jgi:hypothetical protein
VRLSKVDICSDDAGVFPIARFVALETERNGWIG